MEWCIVFKDFAAVDEAEAVVCELLWEVGSDERFEGEGGCC